MAEGGEYSSDHCIVIMNYRFLAMRYEYLTERERRKTQLTGISLEANPLTPVSYNSDALQKTHGRSKTVKTTLETQTIILRLLVETRWPRLACKMLLSSARVRAVLAFVVLISLMLD